MIEKKNMTPEKMEKAKELMGACQAFAKENGFFLTMQLIEKESHQAVSCAYNSGKINTKDVSAMMTGIYEILNRLTGTDPMVAAMIGAAEGKRYAGEHGPCLAPQAVPVMQKVIAERRSKN